MKNNNVKVSKPKKPAKSKVYTQKKPAKKLKLKKVETDANSIQNVNYVPPAYNENTYTTQENSTTTYTTIESNSVYAKLDDPVETDVKRSEILPEAKDNSNANTIIILIGVAAFAALLLLLI